MRSDITSRTLLGIADKVHQARQQAGKAEGNALSVRMELQADCLAGVWGKRTDTMKKVLEPGDLDSSTDRRHSHRR